MARKSAGTPEEKAARREADLLARKAKRDAEKAAKREAFHAERVKAEAIIRAEVKKGAIQAMERGKKTGRPRIMSPELEADVLERVANGESLASITRDEDMPSASTVLRHAASSPAFDQALARARAMQADVLFDACLAIADDDEADLIPAGGKEGGLVANTTAVTRAKLKIETRLRMAAQINPPRYAEKAQALAGPVTVNVNTLALDARAMSPEARERLRSVLLEAKALPPVVDYDAGDR